MSLRIQWVGSSAAGPTQPAAANRLPPRKRRWLRKAVLMLAIGGGAWTGYQVGEKLGALLALRNLIERHYPGLVEIGDSMRRLPGLSERLIEALAVPRLDCRLAERTPSQPRPAKPQPRDTRPRQAPEPSPSNARRYLTERYPAHWDDDPFANRN